MKSFVKYLGLFLIVLGVVLLLTSKSSAAEVTLLTGLFILFTSFQAKEDERSGAIRSSSAFIALCIGYSLKLVVSSFFSHQMVAFDLNSTNYFLIFVFSLANILRFSRLYIFMA